MPILLLLIIPTLLLASCAPATSEDVLPATISSEIAAAAATSTAMPDNTAVPTDSPTISPPEPTPQISPTSPATATVPAAPQVHVVQAGDNLTSIAETFGTTVEAIQNANELVDINAIIVGQELEIPLANEQAAPPTAGVEASPTAEIIGTTSSQPLETTAPAETGEAAADRGILHNQVLCPDPASIPQEGGQVVGFSAVCRLPITSYQIGEGETPIVIVGGMHGGYEWNTILLAYEILDYLQRNPAVIPPELTIYIIPNANPDGLYAVSGQSGRFSPANLDEDTVPGRFNGNNVDLNRNWECQWTPYAVWRDTPISGGSAPFSEPENQIIRDFIVARDPAAAVFLHSAATGVYASGCGQTDPASKTLAGVYSQASGYPLYDTFEYYDLTGDAADWLASQNIPSISVELSTHQAFDWNMNLAGLNALMNHVASADGENE